MAKVGAANLQFYAAQCSQQEMTYWYQKLAMGLQ